MKRVALLLADGFEEVEAITPIDFLRRAGIQVDLLGVKSEMVTGSHGISVKADTRIMGYRTMPDGVILPGGMPGAQNIADSSEAITLAKMVGEAGNMIAAICAAPAVVLAAHGFLDGKRATCYPGYESAFGENTEFSEESVVVDGTTITSRGAGTAAAFSLAVIRYLAGSEAADKVARETLQSTK